MPLAEELAHVGGEILDHRHVLERRDGELAALGDLGDVGAAGPARAAVHGHGAGAAHADAAGEAVGQGRVEMPLHISDDVEHRLTLARRHGIIDIAAVAAAAPQRDL